MMDSFPCDGVLAVLILSRKENQQILFPGLGIEVEVTRITGKSVRVGINAPKSVRILRGELLDSAAPSAEGVDLAANELQHTLRNQLNKAQLAVAIAQKQLKMGNHQQAEQTLQDMLDRLTEIDQQISGPTSESTSPPVESANPGESGPKALVVEDDENERTLLAGYLRLCGFDISEASDGIEALEYLSENDVDLVVLDVCMPRMNGIETIREIQSRPSLQDTRVVIVSGEDRDESMITGDNCGVTEWFSKPLLPDQLVGHLNDSLD